MENRLQFIDLLRKDIRALSRLANRRGLIPAIRLNGTSDIAWELRHPELFQEFSSIQFYDYTKLVGRLQRKLPANYYLTFSQSEKNSHEVDLALKLGYNVAVVFAGKELPIRYLGRRVFNGDNSDCRFLDPQRVIVGLKPKGKARGRSNRFIIAER